MILVAHSHIGGLETREQLLRYLDERPGTYACPDTGHLLLCGSDPAQTIRDLGARCRYIHLKDIDPAKVGTKSADGSCFWELGAGALDLAGVFGALKSIGYDGWVMVERDRRVPDYRHARAICEERSKDFEGAMVAQIGDMLAADLQDSFCALGAHPAL